MFREKEVSGFALVCAVTLLAVSSLEASDNSSDAYWSGDFAEADFVTNVRALQVYDGKLFVSADFAFPSDPLMRKLGTWDGNAWGNLGGGTSDNVNAMTIYNGELIVAGTFWQAGGVSTRDIARWNGTAWQSLGNGLTGGVSALAVWNGSLFAAIGASVYAWDGSNWSVVGAAGAGFNGLGGSTKISSLTTYNNQLVAAADYLGSGSMVRAWGGSSWVTLGSMSQMSGVIPASLSVFGTDLYMGVQVPPGAYQYSLWKFNGFAWIGLVQVSVPPISPAYAVRFLVPDGAQLILGGQLKAQGLPSDSNLFTYNGTTLLPLKSESPMALTAYASFNASEYIGSATGVQHWEATEWANEFWAHPAQFGMNGEVSALLLWNELLVAGGNFTFSGSAQSNRIAVWNDTTWAALGSGMNNKVFCLGEFQGELYAGGAFTTAGGQPARHVARWGGGNWHAVDTSLTDWPKKCTVFQDELIFTAGGGLVGWNGTSWRVIADSIIGDVLTLQPYNGLLYAGGLFTQIEAVNASRVAAWDGSIWSPLQSGIVGNVYSMRPSGGQLYVGGSFGQAGQVCANRLASWNGSNWSAGTTGLNEAIYEIGSYGSELIVTGPFTMAGGDSANRVAQLNGSVMSAMGSGIDVPFQAAAEYHGSLYLGGSFTKAGGKPSSYIAKWTGPVAQSRSYSVNQLATLAITDTCALDCCHGNVGNVDCDPQNGIDISDLTRMIDYLYISFAPLCCPPSSNVDGSLEGSVDISDLAALIDYLYISFTATLPCP